MIPVQLSSEPLVSPVGKSGIVRMLGYCVGHDGARCTDEQTIAVLMRFGLRSVCFDIVGDYTLSFTSTATDPRLELAFDGVVFATRALWRGFGYGVLIGESLELQGSEVE